MIAGLCVVGCGQPSQDSITLSTTPFTGENTDYKTEYNQDVLVDIKIETLRSEIAQLQLQNQKTYSLRLPNQQTLDINFETINLEGSNIQASGSLLQNPEAQVNLIIQDETLLLTVKSEIENENLEIRSVGNNQYVMGTPTPSEETECEVEYPHTEEHDSHDHAMESHVAEEESMIETAAITAQATSSKPVVDILGVYTPAARAKEGSKSAIEALFKQAILETNKALANSKVNATVRLVGIKELSSNETGNYSTDLAYLANKRGSSQDRNGKWDEVHAWREQLGADQVTMLGAYTKSYPSSTLGLGYKQAADNKPALASSAFTVTKTTAARRYYTITHELGHNLGLDHSDGYSSSRGRFQTLIHKLGSYARILYFSNPSVTYKGYATGTSYYNEAAVVSRNVKTLSNYRSSKF